MQVLPTPERITILTQPLSAAAACPDCGTMSSHLHSRYERILGDLPWQGRPVVLRIQARRFRCSCPACPRQTFAEQLGDVAAAWVRRTGRLGALQHHLGLALGGRAGARLAERLSMPASPDTLRRMLVRQACGGADPPTPRVLAIDDWAWRRGHRYGTVLVDLERNRVVDLLPDRQADTLAAWLRGHPGVEVIARDRAGAYADGARQGAPDAKQVTDRWHLLRNLGTAMQALADRHSAAARRAAQHAPDEQPPARAHVSVPTPAPHKATAAERASQASLARRQARYEEAARLRADGVSISRIAVLLEAERKTVRRWLRLGHAPSWAKPRRGGVLDACVAHLDRRWTEGCRNATQLWHELAGLGFTGRPTTVRAWAGRRRKDELAETRSSAKCGAFARCGWDGDTDEAGAGRVARQPPPARRIARLLMADTDALPEAERGFVARLLAEAPGLADAIAIAKRLNLLLRRKGQESLGKVLEDVAATQLAEFAASLRRDLAAVQAALDTPWTTSPAEGQINRIKTIKRSMYGRAGFALLRARVLQAA